MPAELTAAQIGQIAATLDANPKAQAHLNALLGITPEDIDTPKPAVITAPSVQSTIVTSAPADANSKGKQTDNTARHEKSLTIQIKDEVTKSSDLLAIVKDLNIPRRVKYEISTFVPNTSALFATLHEMERFATKKFKVRRSVLTYSPAHNALWFTLLVNIQTARCMLYANQLKQPADVDTLNTFLSSFPPEKLAIPGPLLPFFQAITTYKVQNALYGRVTPSLPYQYFTSDDNIEKGPSGYFFPYLPLVANMVDKFHNDLQTVDATKLTDKFTKYYPFEFKSTDSKYKNSIKFAGSTYDESSANWTDMQAANLCNPALRFRFPYQKDLVTNLKDTLEDYEMPVIADRANISTLKQILCLTDTTWVRQFLTPMAAYAAIWKGSGTLADCAIDGPPVGAHIAKYMDSTTAPVKPEMPFDRRTYFNLACRLRTTQGTAEQIPETLAALTQIHATLADNHWFKSNITAADTRTGNVWALAPIYGPSNEDESLLTISEILPRFLSDKLNV